MKKPPIPRAIGVAEKQQRDILEALKANVEIICGRRGRIADVPPSPTNEELAAKVNEILARLQD